MINVVVLPHIIYLLLDIGKVAKGQPFGGCFVRNPKFVLAHLSFEITIPFKDVHVWRGLSPHRFKQVLQHFVFEI